MTDDEVLSTLAAMEQEQNFFDQMRGSWKYVREVILKYRAIQAKIPELVKEELHLREILNGLDSDIESRRRAGALKIQEEADVLHKQMSDKIGPLAQALEEASQRVVNAEKAAAVAEKDSVERVKSAASAAEEAESRLATAKKGLLEIGSLVRG